MRYPFYAYLHTNGELIRKTSVVCEVGTTPEEYFDSPFVKKWWRVTSLEQWHKILDECNKQNASKAFKEGDTVIYVPTHAHGDTTHPDCEHGFVTSVSERTGTVFCKFYNKDGTLRTVANSEGCNPADLVKTS